MFFLSAIIICAAFVALFFLKEIPLLDRGEEEMAKMVEATEGKMVSKVVLD